MLPVQQVIAALGQTQGEALVPQSAFCAQRFCTGSHAYRPGSATHPPLSLPGKPLFLQEVGLLVICQSGGQESWLWGGWLGARVWL